MRFEPTYARACPEGRRVTPFLVAAVLEPVKRAYLTFPQPLEIYLPEEPLPDDAQVQP